jgi:UDP-GlcNAc:undecaprenyl-phosphate GlcNAc-1-phosphate transferase
LVNSVLVAAQFLYVRFRYEYVNAEIPLWYTKPWGDPQLAPKEFLFLIPASAFVLLILAVILFLLLDRYFVRYISHIFSYMLIVSNIVLFYSVYRIIQVASVPFDPLVEPNYLNLLMPFVVTVLVVYYVLPVFINFAQEKNLVTNPNIHDHPGMILTKPSVRGGGMVYAVVFLLMSLLFVGFKLELSGFYLSVLMVGALGIMDDIQNTNVRSNLRILENPYLRLFLLFVAVAPVILSNIMIDIVSNPFGGMFDLTQFRVELFGNSISLIAALITVLWIVWVMNVLSWSNGIDGQYSGIVGIASIIIALLALRFEPLESFQLEVGILAAISAGAAIGFARYTWPPSKILWGFGAMSAGLVLAVLSILVQSKILTSVMIILIPFLDALVTAVRRIFQKKNPLHGDKGHLHHLLLERGWSAKRIALFYWFATLLFGGIGFFTAETYAVQVALIIGGIVAFFIVLLNVISIKERNHKQEPEPEVPEEEPRPPVIVFEQPKQD